MKVKKNIRRITEPLIYMVLVAAFGFITTVVNHSGKEEQVREAELVTLSLENELGSLFYHDVTGVSL